MEHIEIKYKKPRSITHVVHKELDQGESLSVESLVIRHWRSGYTKQQIENAVDTLFKSGKIKSKKYRDETYWYSVSDYRKHDKVEYED